MDIQVRRNAAGLIVSGDRNPRWRGGPLQKKCVQCGNEYIVSRYQEKSRFCSLQCFGESQRGVLRKKRSTPKVNKNSGSIKKICVVCGGSYNVYPAHAHRHFCCSRKCQGIRRAQLQSGENNHNWNNGSSRLPYPYDWKSISESIIDRDGNICKGPECRKVDQRLTAHHIDFDKSNCDEKNLITLCSSCNTRANFNRPYWIGVYQELMRDAYL